MAARAWTVIALSASTVAILTVALPGLGFGETTTTHSGSPSDVYTSTDPGVCNGEDKAGIEPVVLLPTAIHVGEPSDVLAYFTSTWSAGGSPTELLLGLQIEGGDQLVASPEWIANTQMGESERDAHGVGTIMWSFPALAPGDYTVEATAHIAGFPGTNKLSGANLQACALTAIVMPVSG